MTRRQILLYALVAGSRAARGGGPVSAQSVTQPLPPLSWTCPMHAEVVEARAGACPICRMTLVPVRLALVWSCTVHSDIAADRAGDCKICGRPLVRVTKAVSWTCPVHPKVDVIEPGRCPTCRRVLRMKYARRPHGDHNPKHGGLFFMAPNNWHLEATYPSPGLVRLFVYNEYSDPFIPPGFSGRTIATQSPGAGARPAAETSVPFVRSGGRLYLEARITRRAVPASIIVKVRFQPSDPEYLFNFDFQEYSREPGRRRGPTPGIW
jgi:hypothetical protein